MNKFIELVEKHLVPVASKVAGQRHLSSIKDGFLAILPITMAGSFAVLFAVFFRDIPTAINGGEVTAFTESMQPVLNVLGDISSSTISLMALVFTFGYAYSLAQTDGKDPLPAGLVGVSILFTTMPKTVGEEALSGISFDYLGSGGLFTALIFVTIFIELYLLIVRKGITIKMPEGVPPAVAKSFAALIPGLSAIFASAFVASFISWVVGMPITDFIAEMIQAPLMGLSQGLPAVIIVTFVTQVLWFFGLHGMLVLTPIYESLWGAALVQNMADVAAGVEPTYLWVRGSFDIYGMMGGSGGTLGLLAAMFIVGKRQDTKQIAKIGIAPGLFNINEPLIFGMPIILNPMYLIPWVLVPIITLTFGYIMTAIGFAGPVIAAVPWVTPGVLSALLSTGGSIGAAITALICLIFTVIAWIPFVMANERNQ